MDIHKTKRAYRIALERLRSDTYICDENKKLTLQYTGISDLSFPFDQKHTSATLPTQAQIAGTSINIGVKALLD